MITFKEFLIEAKAVSWSKPNFEDEFDEVLHQTEMKAYFKTKKNWLKFAETGKQATLSKGQVDSLVNHTADKSEWKQLETDKTNRVTKLFAAGKVELPIVLRDGELLYLLAGNTRLNYSNNNGFGRQVWLIDTPDLENFL